MVFKLGLNWCKNGSLGFLIRLHQNKAGQLHGQARKLKIRLVQIGYLQISHKQRHWPDCRCAGLLITNTRSKGSCIEPIWVSLKKCIYFMYLHFRCESLNECVHLRCPSYLHSQIHLSHTHICAIGASQRQLSNSIACLLTFVWRWTCIAMTLSPVSRVMWKLKIDTWLRT